MATEQNNTTGSQTGGMGSGPQSNMGGGASGGHSVSQAGPTTFTNMQIPGLTFPASIQQIQQSLQTLPQEQQQQWTPILAHLPTDQTFNSLQELQQACQTVYQKQNA